MPAVYRFAFLMTGTPLAAAEVLQHTVEEAEREELGGEHDAWQVRRWLFTQAYEAACRRPRAVAASALTPVPGPGEDPPFSATSGASVPTADAAGDSSLQLALLFGGLPEAERAALILFYLYLFTPKELAEIMEVRPDDLGTLLTRGRALLQKGEGKRQKAESKSPAESDPIGVV